MGVIGWTWLLVAASLALQAAVAVRARARATADLYVAEPTVRPAVSGMATASDWISAASFMSVAGVIAFAGRDGAAYLMGWTGGYVLLAVLLAPYLRKWGKYTVPQFVADRYYSRGARVVATGCALVVSFTYVAAQVRGVGIVLAGVAGVRMEAAVALGAAAVLAFAVLGGLKGVTASQVAQYLVVLLALVVPAVLVSQALTGNPFPPLGLGDRLTAEGAARLRAAPGAHLLAALDAALRDLRFPAFTAGAGRRADVLATTAALMIGTAGLPHILVRFFTVPKIRDARATAAWALLFLALFYASVPAVAAFGRGLLVASVEGARGEAPPAWWPRWQEAGLVAWNDRNGDGVMQLSGDPARNEVRVDHDVLVLAEPELAGLPPWVAGLVAAGALGAALSTGAALLLVIASGVAHDLVRGVVSPRLSERAELWWARAGAVLAALGAGWLALRPPGAIAETVAIAFGLAASSFFPVLVLGVFWKRATREGAIAGMIAGMLFTLGYVLWFKRVHPELDIPARWWLGVSPQGIGVVGAAVNAAAVVAVSLATPAPPARVQELVEALRTPREAAPEGVAAAEPPGR